MSWSRRPQAGGRQLATLHLQAGQLDDGHKYALRALEAATAVRSARLADHLAVLRTAAAAHHLEPELAELVATIDTRLRPRDPSDTDTPTSLTAAQTRTSTAPTGGAVLVCAIRMPTRRG